MIVAELRIVPLGEGTSMHEPVQRVVEALRQEGVRYEVGPMGTTIEAERLDQILHAAGAAHEAARRSAGRVLTELAIDDRRDKEETARTLRQV